MNRIECSVTAAVLALAIGLAPVGSPAAADQKSPTGQVRAKSPAAEAPLLGRVVVTPSPEQLARIRLERRMIGLEHKAAGTHQAGNAAPEMTGAL